jgi:NACHT domain
VLPIITDYETNFCWNLELGWKLMLKEFIHPEQLAVSPQVTPPYAAWLLVAAAGRGKTRFARELAEAISVREPGCQVVRVKLRKHSAFLESCEVKPDTLENYIQHFANGCNLTSKKLVFIFDGYEQVCKLYSSVLDKLFKKISINRHPMLITTRPDAEYEVTMAQVKSAYHISN